QYLYPANAWRADEVIVETIALAVPADAPPGGGRLQLGVYTWPSLTRLPIPGHADDVLVLPAVTIGP
ncbi:MAG: hypothetical protein JNK29_17790, partial [Anaerolineales bacterium]|nr:hypothetical protein [Anaerolineales bacterium]